MVSKHARGRPIYLLSIHPEIHGGKNLSYSLFPEYFQGFVGKCYILLLETLASLLIWENGTSLRWSTLNKNGSKEEVRVEEKFKNKEQC